MELYNTNLFKALSVLICLAKSTRWLYVYSESGILIPDKRLSKGEARGRQANGKRRKHFLNFSDRKEKKTFAQAQLGKLRRRKMVFDFRENRQRLLNFLSYFWKTLALIFAEIFSLFTF